MRFEEKINYLISENEIPDCISPQNIAIMLKQKTAEKNTRPSVPAIGMKSKKQAIRFRSSAAAAACVALVVGVMAFASDSGTALPIGYFTSVAEVKEAEDYSDVYKVIQDAFIKGGSLIQTQPSTPKPTKDTTPVVTEPNLTPDPAEETSVQYNLLYKAPEGVTQEDILRTDGTNLYYIKNNSLYFVSANGGKMALLSKVSAANTVPVEVYIDQNKLIVLSNNTVEVPYEVKLSGDSKTTEATAGTQMTPSPPATSSDTAESSDSSETTESSASTTVTTTAVTTALSSKTGTDISGTDAKIPSTIRQSNVIVDVYDITDKAAPKIVTTYKQNGLYISSFMDDSTLYLVTNYSGYQTKPLENQKDLDNYVPAYWVNDSKTYIDAKDIILPPSVSSTSYAVVAGLNVQNTNLLASIKAVLGNVKKTCSGTSALYLVGAGSAISDKDSSTVTKFTLSQGTLAYSANATVEGSLLNEYSMGEQGGSFRIATVTTDSKAGKHWANLYILGVDLKPLGSLTGLFADKTLKTVRFESDMAYLYTEENTEAVSLANPENLQLSESTASIPGAYLFKYADNRLLGIGREYSKDGKLLGVKLTMFDGTMKELHSISLSGGIAPELFGTVIDSRGFIFDAASNRIGIPTESQGEYGFKNLYYMLSYDEEKGFVQTGLLEYTDIDNTFAFNRGVIAGDILYALSGGRIVSAQLADLKVIETLSLK